MSMNSGHAGSTPVRWPAELLSLSPQRSKSEGGSLLCVGWCALGETLRKTEKRCVEVQVLTNAVCGRHRVVSRHDEGTHGAAGAHLQWSAELPISAVHLGPQPP